MKHKFSLTPIQALLFLAMIGLMTLQSFSTSTDNDFQRDDFTLAMDEIVLPISENGILKFESRDHLEMYRRLIEEIEDANPDDPEYDPSIILDDLESKFEYKSYRSKLEEDFENVSPEVNPFDAVHLHTTDLQSVFNTKYELIIGDEYLNFTDLNNIISIPSINDDKLSFVRELEAGSLDAIDIYNHFAARDIAVELYPQGDTSTLQSRYKDSKPDQSKTFEGVFAWDQFSDCNKTDIYMQAHVKEVSTQFKLKGYYTIDWGDGSPIVSWNVTNRKTRKSIRHHVYSKPGNYQLRLSWVGTKGRFRGKSFSEAITIKTKIGCGNPNGKSEKGFISTWNQGRIHTLSFALWSESNFLNHKIGANAVAKKQKGRRGILRQYRADKIKASMTGTIKDDVCIDLYPRNQSVQRYNKKKVRIVIKLNYPKYRYSVYKGEFGFTINGRDFKKTILLDSCKP